MNARELAHLNLLNRTLEMGYAALSFPRGEMTNQDLINIACDNGPKKVAGLMVLGKKEKYEHQ